MVTVQRRCSMLNFRGSTWTEHVDGKKEGGDDRAWNSSHFYLFFSMSFPKNPPRVSPPSPRLCRSHVIIYPTCASEWKTARKHVWRRQTVIPPCSSILITCLFVCITLASVLCMIWLDHARRRRRRRLRRGWKKNKIKRVGVHPFYRCSGT